MSVENKEKVFCVVFIDIIIIIVIYNPWLAFLIPEQCSPYQAVTSKIYRLKQHFLLLATSWRFAKVDASCDPI